MNIEELVKKDPTGFQNVLDTRTEDIKDAMDDLSARLDAIIGGAIREYAGQSGAEVDIGQIPSYKALNKIITGKLDQMIGEQIREKRKDL